MIEDVWKKMLADPAAKGYSFKTVDPPSPNAGTVSKCRELCAQNLCGAYGTTWACPPGVGTEEECLKKATGYSKAALIIKDFDDVDLEDAALLKKLSAEHQDICRKFGHALRGQGYKALPLSDGGCMYCEKCSYPGAPCRYPDQIVTSISCYGIMMDEYLKKQNIDFKFRKDGMTLYGLILYNEP